MCSASRGLPSLRLNWFVFIPYCSLSLSLSALLYSVSLLSRKSSTAVYTWMTSFSVTLTSSME